MSEASTNIGLIALSILEQFSEWKAEAEQICQCEQSDEPFVPFMLGKIQSLLSHHFGHIKAEVRTWKAREQKSYRNVLRVQRQMKSLVAALREARQFIANGIEFGYIATPAEGSRESKCLPMIDAVLAEERT